MNVANKVRQDQEVLFFHRKVTRSGATRTLSVGKILPSDWLIVKIRIVKLEDKTCVLELTKLD